MTRFTTGGSLARFDRSFFNSEEKYTQIGKGELGGKAHGLVFIQQVIEQRLEPALFPGVTIDIPRMAVITTDFFDAFMRQNDLYEVAYSDGSEERIAHHFLHASLPPDLVGDLRALVNHVNTPLAIRSSSLLEDAMFEPFAGIYETKMIPNNQLEPDTRFRKLVEAVKFVYASTYFRKARNYLAGTRHSPDSEKMAVIIQEVVGQRYGDRFYPNISGVARSYNFYPIGSARPEEGVVNLALGLGKTIVDGGVSWIYSPQFPHISAPFGSVQEILRRTQTRFWAVNMGQLSAYDPMKETEYLVEADISIAEEDQAILGIASTYDPAADRIIPGITRKGPRVLDFAPILKYRQSPINEIIECLLKFSEEATGSDVEMEFAVTFDRRSGRQPRFGLLQVRPMAVTEDLVDLTEEELVEKRVVVASEQALGNGERSDIRDIVYVLPERFATEHTPKIARELEDINRPLTAAGTPYVLIGFGRWGSSDPWLGIPVDWGQISGARVIVESTLPEIYVDLSQGSHFFHNLIGFKVSYLLVSHAGKHRIDWQWLAYQELVRETQFIRHVRVSTPLKISVDGRSRRGVIRR